MIYVLVAISLLFFAVGYILTENNAKYLLSGYNTMSEEDRKKVDISSFVIYYRKFHVFLSISLLIGGLITNSLISEVACGIFLGTYPILAYIYFIWNSRRFSSELNTSSNKVGIIVLAATLIFVLVLFGYGFKENQLLVNNDSIEFTGPYGEKIANEDIQSIELVNSLPKVNFKRNGFALGSMNKGYFKTDDGVIIKLLLNSDSYPIILIGKKSGDKIYYSAKNFSNDQIFNDISTILWNN